MGRQAEVLDRVLLEGDALLREGRFAEGEGRAQAVLARQPRNAGAHYLLGLSALMQERHAEALAHAQRAIGLDRVNAQFHFLAALCLAPMRRFDEAIASYRRALQFRPEFLQARANLGYVYECAGRIPEAAECYRRALAQDPDEWFSLNRLGYCERVLGRAEAALEPLARALALEPRSAPTHNEMALALLQLGRRPEAIARLRAAVEVQPDFAQGWANLCKVLYVEHVEAGRRAERGEGPAPDPAAVIECFDRMLAFDPSNAEFKYLRDSLAGVPVERPPDQYIESFFDRFAAQFEQRVVGELGYRAPALAQELLDPLLGAEARLRVADLGCGTGLFAEYLRSKAAHLAGVDLSEEMLARARARGAYDTLERAEIGDWLERAAAGSIDLAVALDVFIYVGALERVLGALGRALAPGGLVAFSVEELEEGEDDFRLLPSGRYAHAASCVRRVLEGAGLAIEAERPCELRVEAGRPVASRLFVARRPP